MNTFLKLLAITLTAAVPVSFGAESLGVSLPNAVGSDNILGAFVVAWILVVMIADYRSPKPLPTPSAAAGARCASDRAALRLAA